jgi:argininosuccinate synthase
MSRHVSPPAAERIVVPVTSVDAAEVVAELSRRDAAEVIAVAVDVGQTAPLDELRDVALAAGAVRCHVFDRRERLAAHFLWPALRAGLLAVPGEPVVTALTAPCVAEVVVEVARFEHATAMAAAAPGPRERQRLLAALRDLTPELGIVAVGGGTGGGDERNLWARVHHIAAAGAFPADSAAAAAAPAHLVVTIEHGLPVAINRVPMPPAEIVDSLTAIARAHRVAPAPAVGPAGERWLVDAPAAVALHCACAALAEQSLDDATQTFAADAAETYAGLVRDGHWFTPLRGGLEAFSAHVLDLASGEVAMTMQHRRIEVAR